MGNVCSVLNFGWPPILTTAKEAICFMKSKSNLLLTKWTIKYIKFAEPTANTRAFYTVLSELRAKK